MEASAPKCEPTSFYLFGCASYTSHRNAARRAYLVPRALGSNVFFLLAASSVRTSLGCSKRGGGERELHFCTHTCGARHARRAGYQRKLGSACLPASRRIADSNAALRRVRRSASSLTPLFSFPLSPSSTGLFIFFAAHAWPDNRAPHPNRKHGPPS